MQRRGWLVLGLLGLALFVPGCEGDPAPSVCDGGALGGHPDPRFPICTGPHIYLTCDSCHVPRLGADLARNVSCIDCHTHDQATEAASHAAVSQYLYQPDRPAFCRDCHPSGGL